MISVDELANILNNEMSISFIEAVIELYKDGNDPIDPEHPDMEGVLEKIVDKINDLETLPLEDDYA